MGGRRKGHQLEELVAMITSENRRSEMCWGRKLVVKRSWECHSASASSATSLVRSTAFLGLIVIITTLTNTSDVPTTVRGPTASPPREYPTTTATTGFTYAYVPTFVGDS